MHDDAKQNESLNYYTTNWSPESSKSILSLNSSLLSPVLSSAGLSQFILQTGSKMLN